MFKPYQIIKPDDQNMGPEQDLLITTCQTVKYLDWIFMVPSRWFIMISSTTINPVFLLVAQLLPVTLLLLLQLA